MTIYAVLLPLLLLALKLGFKLLVHRTATLADVILTSLAFPIDVAFVSMSLLAGYIISDRLAAPLGTLLILSFLLIAMLNVVAWRMAEQWFISDKIWRAFSGGFGSFALAMSTIVIAVACILGFSK